MNESPDQPAEIIVVGTAHISEESIAEVRRTIEAERPDVVAVELDPGRYQALTNPEQQSASIKDILSSGKLYQFLVHRRLARRRAACLWVLVCPSRCLCGWFCYS